MYNSECGNMNLIVQNNHNIYRDNKNYYTITIESSTDLKLFLNK